MQNLSSKENFFIGLALSNSSNYDSSICVLDRDKNIVLLDKFYFAQDIDFFFENSPYIKNSSICVSVPYDNRMLDGKWRIHSKNYKALGEYFKIIRADINQLRQSYGLNPHYLSRTSIDCKNLQISLKLKYGFSQLPDNMLPASGLESILCSMFAKDYSDNVKTSTMFEIDEIPVLARKENN